LNVVTGTFQKYRISARLVWNFFFWPDADLADWDGRDQFEKIKNLLFDSIVLRKLSFGTSDARFVIVPRSKEGVPAMIEQPRADDRNRYWDHPIGALGPSDAVLEFLDYFDWDQTGCLDFRYVRVRICEFPLHPDLVGREALLEAEHVDVCITQRA
jgi:hypothetical protein